MAFAGEGLFRLPVAVPPAHRRQRILVGVQFAMKLADQRIRLVSGEMAHGVVDVPDPQTIVLKSVHRHDDTFVDALHHSGQEFE